MPKDRFSFKQFTIYQARSAMKVCTEACILGAYAASGSFHKPQQALDIGSGTGLLSLMLAQRFPNLQITGVEIDKEASEEAQENVKNSPWKDRVSIINASIQVFQPEQGPETFDLILTNPPFFTRKLKSPIRPDRNQVRHNESLSHEDLLQAIQYHLKEDGEAYLLVPPDEWKIMSRLLSGYGLQAFHFLSISDQHRSRVLSLIVGLGKRPSDEPINRELWIKSGSQLKGENAYSTAFTRLLAPFYLHL